MGRAGRRAWRLTTNGSTHQRHYHIVAGMRLAPGTARRPTSRWSSKNARVAPVDAELYGLQPWYHDFSALGFDTTFLGVPLTLKERIRRASEVVGFLLKRSWRGRRTTPEPREGARWPREVVRRIPSAHVLNQPVKEQHLIRFVAHALSVLGPRPNCLELFSADGYYSCRIKMLSPQARITGVEVDPEQIRRAETIARRLAFRDVRFHRRDVWTFLEQSSGGYDLVLCAGGLYHVSDPARLFAAIQRVGARYLVAQSVVTLETENPDYFVQPANGWQHGCRFTHAWLRARLEALGWHILEEARAELPGNHRPHDRGSSFFLCQADAPRGASGSA
jgi:SAM-dependent methyltransferase